MNEEKIVKLILNPIHKKYKDIPKRRYHVPKLDYFNQEIKFETIWFCYLNDFNNYIKNKIK